MLSSSALYCSVRSLQFFQVISEQAILDMQYELAEHRHMQVDEDLPSRSLLYFYSRYKKEREERARQEQSRKSR